MRCSRCGCRKNPHPESYWKYLLSQLRKGPIKIRKPGQFRLPHEEYSELSVIPESFYAHQVEAELQRQEIEAEAAREGRLDDIDPNSPILKDVANLLEFGANYRKLQRDLGLDLDALRGYVDRAESLGLIEKHWRPEHRDNPFLL